MTSTDAQTMISEVRKFLVLYKVTHPDHPDFNAKTFEEIQRGFPGILDLFNAVNTFTDASVSVLEACDSLQLDEYEVEEAHKAVAEFDEYLAKAAS